MHELSRPTSVFCGGFKEPSTLSPARNTVSIIFLTSSSSFLLGLLEFCKGHHGRARNYSSIRSYRHTQASLKPKWRLLGEHHCVIFRSPVSYSGGLGFESRPGYGNPVWGFSCRSSITSRKCQDSSLKYRVIEKSSNTFWLMFYFSKTKLHSNQKTKNNVILLLEMSTAFSDAFIHSFPHDWCNPVKSSCVAETVHQTRYCRFVWHGKIGKCVPKLILAS
jgi:hypothetical protein